MKTKVQHKEHFSELTEDVCITNDVNSRSLNQNSNMASKTSSVKIQQIAL